MLYQRPTTRLGGYLGSKNVHLSTKDHRWQDVTHSHTAGAISNLAITAQDLAEADASAVIESLDGISVRVEVPSTHLVRLWIYIHPWRLYENLSVRAVEALGLDPSKGVTVRPHHVPSISIRVDTSISVLLGRQLYDVTFPPVLAWTKAFVVRGRTSSNLELF